MLGGTGADSRRTAVKLVGRRTRGEARHGDSGGMHRRTNRLNIFHGGDRRGDALGRFDAVGSLGLRSDGSRHVHIWGALDTVRDRVHVVQVVGALDDGIGRADVQSFF